MEPQPTARDGGLSRRGELHLRSIGAGDVDRQLRLLAARCGGNGRPERRRVATVAGRVEHPDRRGGTPPAKICFGHYCTVAAGTGAAKGGYNVFRVFVANYLTIVEECLRRGVVSRAQYRKAKSRLFRRFVARRVVWLLFRSKHITRFDNREAWRIVLEHYGRQPYFYLITFYKSLHYLLRGCR